MEKLINKIKHCDNPQMLLQMEDEFNAVGMSVQLTNSDKVLLCKINDGRPTASKIFEDYVPVGLLTCELSNRAIDRIIGFLIENYSERSEIAGSKNTGNFGLYGSSFHDNVTAASRLINAIAEWIDE